MAKQIHFVTLSGSERTPLPGAIAVGPTSANEWIEVTIQLARKRPLPAADKIGALLPKDRKYVSRDQFADQYGADERSIKLVTTFAKEHQLAVIETSLAARTVKLAGTADAMQGAFKIKLLNFAHSSGNYRGRVGPIQLPKELEGTVLGVFGLDNRRQAKTRSIIRPLPSGTSHTTQKRGWFLPQELGAIYSFPPGTGEGHCLGLLEFGGGFSDTDLSTYFNTVGSPKPNVIAVPVDHVGNKPGIDPDSDGEVMLDIEVAGALIPDAKIAVYFAHFTEKGWVDAIGAAIHDKTNAPGVISVSWGYAEGNLIWTAGAISAVNEYLQDAAALGVSVCVASGDDGSSDDVEDGHGHVDFPASSPYSLGVGGTTVKASGGKISSEVVWNDGPRATAGGAGGGGISSMNPLPAWQKGIVGPSANSPHLPGRGCPDVAADADPQTGYFTRSGGQNGVAGGTSAAAPLWGALLIRINQNLGKNVGYFNPLLYKTIGPAGVLRDIIKGNNDTQGLVGGYSATKGWDACTGWGTPVGTALLAAFKGKV